MTVYCLLLKRATSSFVRQLGYEQSNSDDNFVMCDAEKEDEISQKDLQVIEDVLTKVVDTKAKMEIEKQELAELKEDVNDYKEVCSQLLLLLCISRANKCGAN